LERTGLLPADYTNIQENPVAVEQGQSTEKTSKDAAARRLALTHFEIEDGLTHIFRITGPAEVEENESEPIKLLEVNEATVPSGVMPLHFGAAPARGIPYPSIIVEVTPDEFEQIIAQAVKLPKGWAIGEELPKPVVNDDRNI
jgi:hypothetical protein